MAHNDVSQLPDTVFIRELVLRAKLGILPWELISEQSIVVDIAYRVNATELADRDAIAEAIDYTVVAAAIEDYLQHHRFNLLETLADRLAAHLLKTFTFQWVKLSIIKPHAITLAKGVGIVIERSREL